MTKFLVRVSQEGNVLRWSVHDAQLDWINPEKLMAEGQGSVRAQGLLVKQAQRHVRVPGHKLWWSKMEFCTFNSTSCALVVPASVLEG